MRQSRTRFDTLWLGAVITALALACPGGALLAQEIYKSIDAQGHVVYSDRASSKSAPKTTVHVDEPDPAEVARLAKEQQTLNAAAIARAQQQAVEDNKKATADHKRQVACDSARNNYYRLKDSPRIYQRDADGNRAYYSDADADTLREQARLTMNTACGT